MSKDKNPRVVISGTQNSAIAFGDNSTASVVNHRSGQNDDVLPKAFQELRESIVQLQLNDAQKGLIQADIDALENASANDQPDKVEMILKGMSDKLKMIGVIITDVATILSPLNVIAKVFGLSAKIFGG